VSGDVLAILRRSRTPLLSRNFTLAANNDSEERSILSTRGKLAQIREVNVTNVCWSPHKFHFFSTFDWKTDEPFVKFKSGGVLTAKRASLPSLPAYREQRSIEMLWKGSNLVVDFPNFEPLDWKWMRTEAAPLVFLQHSRRFDQVLALRAQNNLDYLGDIGRVLLVNRDHMGCSTEAEIHHLYFSEEALSHFRASLLPKTGEKGGVVILKSNATLFNVTNLEGLAGRICPDCEIRTVVAELENPVKLRGIMYSAAYVVAPYSSVISQAFWMSGLLIEIIPNGTECQTWTFEVSKAAQIKHVRIAHGQEVQLAGMPESQCPASVDQLYNTTVTVDLERTLSIIQARL
jgi:hypothetical protein